MAISFDSKNPLSGFTGSDYNTPAPTFVDIDGDKDLDAFIGDGAIISFFQNKGSQKNPKYQEIKGKKNPFNGLDLDYDSYFDDDIKPTFVDIDGDKDLDAFLGNSAGTINFFENIGSKKKPKFVANSVGNPLSGVDVGSDSAPAFLDIDNDKDFDVFVGNSDGTISFYQNIGKKNNPRFREQTGNKNPFDGLNVGYQSTPTVVDIDKDNDFDVFVGNGDGIIKLFENTGSKKRASFSQVIGNGNPLLGKDVGDDSIPAFADIDNDKDFDVFIGNNLGYFSNGTIKYIENVGNEKKPDFTTNPLVLVDVGSGNIPSLADVDGDGDLDAVIGNGDGTLSFFKNVGNNKRPLFTQPVPNQNPFFGLDVGSNSSPALVDIDNDGDLDAFSGNYDGNFIFFKNIGSKTNPRFSYSNDNPFASLNATTNSNLTFGDIDNDGDFDAFSGSSDGTIIFLRNVGNKKNPEFAQIGGSGNPFNNIDVGSDSVVTLIDRDGDKDLDAFVGNYDGTVKFFENTGTKKKAKFTERTGKKNPFDGVDIGYDSTPTFGDLDGDGDADALVGDSDGFVSFFENTAPAKKKRSQSVATRSAKNIQENDETDSLLNGGDEISNQATDIDNIVLGEVAFSTINVEPLTEDGATNILDDNLETDDTGNTVFYSQENTLFSVV